MSNQSTGTIEIPFIWKSNIVQGFDSCVCSSVSVGCIVDVQVLLTEVHVSIIQELVKLRTYEGGDL